MFRTRGICYMRWPKVRPGQQPSAQEPRDTCQAVNHLSACILYFMYVKSKYLYCALTQVTTFGNLTFTQNLISIVLLLSRLKIPVLDTQILFSQPKMKQIPVPILPPQNACYNIKYANVTSHWHCQSGRPYAHIVCLFLF